MNWVKKNAFRYSENFAVFIWAMVAAKYAEPYIAKAFGWVLAKIIMIVY